MVDYHILQQFVTFYEAGTLRETAEKLHISQPTLTRNMQKLEEIFLELGFEKMIIGEKQYEYLVYNNCYCRITYLQEWRAFVIESADCIEDALNGVLEDGDLYYTDILQENILSKFRSDIVAYYMD